MKLILGLSLHVSKLTAFKNNGFVESGNIVHDLQVLVQKLRIVLGSSEFFCG